MSDQQHIVCPHCDAANRIAAKRLTDKPNCGSCHQSLFTGHSLELTDKNFQKHVTRNALPVLVDFWAPWCGPCKSMAPAYEAAAKQLEPRVRVAKLNTEAEQNVASQFAIRSIPTLVLFRNGQEIARQSGAMQASDIARWVEDHI